MSRWTYAFPRLILAVILLAAVSLTADPAMHWLLDKALGSNSDAPVEIRGVDARWGAAHVSRLLVADPADPARQLLDVDEAVFEYDPWALLQGRLVIRDGQLLGIRIHAEDAPADCQREAARPALVRQAAALGEAWQQAVSAEPRRLQQSAVAVRAERVGRQRTAEFQQIVRKAADWQNRFEELDEMIRVVGDNPLRMTPAYRDRLEQLAAVGDEIVELNDQLAAVQRQAQQDRMTLEQAARDELAALRQEMQLAPISADKLSGYLLEDEWARRVGSWVNWIRQSQQVARLRPTRSRYAWHNARGVDVIFGAGRRSDFVVQNLFLEGSGQVDGQVFRFRGTLQNLSDEPALATQPTKLTLSAEATGAIQLDAVLDRSGDATRDHFRVVCPALAAPRKVWGDPREFAVEAGPGPMRIAMELDVVDGQQIRGHVQFARRDVQLVPSWPGSRRQGEANRTIQDALQEVQEVNGEVQLSGTLQHPVWRLQSDLGEQVASRMRGVLEQEFADRAELLVQQHRALAEQQLQALAERLAGHEQTAVQLLAAKTDELERFRDRIAQRTDLMDRLVRNAGPLENLLRR